MSTSSPIAPSGGGPPEVWLFQLVLHHYRLPVWDRLVERAGNDYVFKVFGPVVNGEVTGGGMRPYIFDNYSHWFKILGVQCASWPQAADKIRAGRPAVVIVNGNTRELSCWSLPKVCHQLGISVISWSKVHSYSGFSSFLVQPLKRWFFKRFDLHMVYGRQSKEELISLGVSPDIIHVAQNTIDTDHIFHETERIAERAAVLREERGLISRKLLVCVGKMVEKKRQRDLIAAWPRIKAKHPDLTMVLVGNGPTLEEVRKLAAETDSENIIVTGRVPLGDDYAWLRAADVVVVPGAVGLAINQSLALGRPTIIADEYGADSEILEHEKTGWRYPRGDVDAIVSSVDYVLTHPAEVERIVQYAQQFMRENVNMDRMAEGTDQAIRHALRLAQQRQAQLAGS